jgi:KipI family sensor histidine kinase inhibitor
MRLQPSGDRGILITLGHGIDPETNGKVTALSAAISKEHIKGIEDLIPSYNQLMIQYDPLMADYEMLCEAIRSLENKIHDVPPYKKETIHIPVLYGGDTGKDLSFVAAHNSLTEEDVVEIHTSTAYLIYMIGFTPGFPYLGELSEKIRTPRLSEPRQRIRAGSVGIADNQTGIYPIDSPGGWRIIGHTPLNLFDWNKKPPALFKPGQYIRFYSITEEEYAAIKQDIKAGTFRIKIEAFDCRKIEVME